MAKDSDEYPKEWLEKLLEMAGLSEPHLRVLQPELRKEIERMLAISGARLSPGEIGRVFNIKASQTDLSESIGKRIAVLRSECRITVPEKRGIFDQND